jgi:hypothetical protein
MKRPKREKILVFIQYGDSSNLAVEGMPEEIAELIRPQIVEAIRSGTYETKITIRVPVNGEARSAQELLDI